MVYYIFPCNIFSDTHIAVVKLFFIAQKICKQLFYLPQMLCLRIYNQICVILSAAI